MAKPDRPCHRCGETKPAEDFVPRGRNCSACRALPFPSDVERGKRPCIRCFEIKPAEMFPWGDGHRGRKHHRRRSSICAVCQDAEAREREQRAKAREASRSTWEQDGVRVRRCSCCKTVFPLLEGFFVETRRDDGEPKTWAHHCKPCQAVRIAAHQKRKLADPATAEETRRKKRERTRRWRHANPERTKQTAAAYRARVRADPERQALRAEAQRMAYRLRREREGADLDTLRLVKPRREVKETGGTVPAGPLAEAIERHVALHKITEAQMLELVGVWARQLLAWRKGDRAEVQQAVAERVLTKIGLCWWDVWTEDDLEAYEAARRVFEAHDLRRAA